MSVNWVDTNVIFLFYIEILLSLQSKGIKFNAELRKQVGVLFGGLGFFAVCKTLIIKRVMFGVRIPYSPLDSI